MSNNQKAKEIATAYYRETNQRYTPAMFTKTISQALKLLVTYSYEEIIEAIEWCSKNPPPKGFTSLGWLSYDMNNILRQSKLKDIKQEQKNVVVETTKERPKYKQYKQSEPNIHGFDFTIFKNEGEN